jgi:hypothetical protein
MTRTGIICAMGWLLVGVASASGGETLRWKLETGQELAVVVEQQTTSQVAFSGKSATTKIDLAMDLAWKVSAAEEDKFTIEQSLTAIRIKLNSPQAGIVEYDSAVKRPTGSSRELAEVMQPLRDSIVTITINGRGEVQDVQPVNDAAKGLFDPSAGESQALSKATVQKLLKQPLAILPEKEMSEGDSWTTTSDLAAALGDFKQTTTYRLTGTIEQDGQKLLKIESTSALKPAAESPERAAAQPKPTLKSHEQSGTLLYSPEEHRLVAAEQTQKIVTERPYRETTIVVTLTSSQKTTLQSK